MKKLTSLGVIVFAGLLAALTVLGLQSSANAYPEVQINLTAKPQQLHGGETFTATGTAVDTKCAWKLTWNGEVRTSSATAKFKTTFTAPDVTEVTDIPLHGVCTYTAPATSTGRGAATWERTINIRVLPANAVVSPPTGGGSDLPNTGGPNMLFLLGGLALLLSGATAVVVARRRAEEADFAGTRA